MVGRLLRALAALIVLVAVVVGAPIALWVVAGCSPRECRPWPRFGTG